MASKRTSNAGSSRFPGSPHPERPRSGFVLRFRHAAIIAAIVTAIAVAIGYWSGWYDPGLFRRFTVPWPDPQMEALCITVGSALVLGPLIWIFWNGSIDFLALVLPLEALNLFAYFAISTTANKIPKEAIGILQMAGLLLMLNALGFCVLLISLFVFYRMMVLFKGRLAVLPRPQELLDERMRKFMRVAACFCALFIFAPIVYTGVIPLFAGKESRMGLLVSDPLRATYNFAETFFPILMGSFFVLIYRKPRRLFGLDGLVFGSLIILQILTTDRSSLLFGMMAAVVLLSMERRWPRWLLVSAFVGYLSVFTFLAGFSSLLRTDPAKLAGAGALTSSIEETFYGDNVIDLHDGAWVLSHWNFEPLMGTSYMGGMVSMMPSGIFPMKKEWHIGLIALRIVGWSEAEIENHFGLRISFFGESFLNFGIAGVFTLAILLGLLFAFILRLTHLAADAEQPCLWRNVLLLLSVQIIKPLSNSADAFYSWSLIGLVFMIWVFVVLPAPPRPKHVRPGALQRR
ncbi:hypothetical protein SAMN05444156_1409 [Verrucomicrobium sp. GAS474]|uniref:O-antigen polymerase n=1 Tax=Verrucomicrobium sp. GAS474 TaxID=1882831 RepID=UPI000879E8D3|nr:O-antigen polymerase [Verrucomicrobium sp. GAS474]SDU00800.1 hypothetical protein SAMN05444156_1409 [Verrucomicrobium sp. GAS474]